MLGAILGDIIGSAYEHRSIKTKDFPLFGIPDDLAKQGTAYLDGALLRVVKRFRARYVEPPTLMGRLLGLFGR